MLFRRDQRMIIACPGTPRPKICQMLAFKGRSVRYNEARAVHMRREIIRKFHLLRNQTVLKISHTIMDTGTAYTKASQWDVTAGDTMSTRTKAKVAISHTKRILIQVMEA